MIVELFGRKQVLSLLLKSRILTFLLDRAAGGAVTKVASYVGSRSVSEGGAPGVREPTLETEILKNIAREKECIS